MTKHISSSVDRRYKYKQQDSQDHDIVFIDGGKGQLSQAESHFAQWPYAKKPLLIGVAKGTSRKAGLETLIMAYSRETIPWRQMIWALSHSTYSR